MKNRIKILLGAVIGSSLLLSSCNFLDVDNYFQATFKEDSIFHSMKMPKDTFGTPRPVFPMRVPFGETHGIREKLPRTRLPSDGRPTSFGERNSVLVLSTEETCGRIYGIACM